MNTMPSPATTELPKRHVFVPKVIFFVSVGLMLLVGLLTRQNTLDLVTSSKITRQKLDDEEFLRVENLRKEVRKLEAQAEEARKRPQQAEEVRKLEAQAEEARKLTTQEETQLAAYGKPADLGHDSGVRLAMQVVVSSVLLLATLFVVLSKKYDAKDKHWAYTTIGLIVGFWLNS
jgi:hypothetical protein